MHASHGFPGNVHPGNKDLKLLANIEGALTSYVRRHAVPIINHAIAEKYA